MKQLTMKDLYEICKSFKGMGYDLSTLPVYLGNDDELNGIHCAWYCQEVDKNDKSEMSQYLVEMINGYHGNNELKGKGVLIS